MAAPSIVHLLVSVEGFGPGPHRAVGLYWPATGALSLQGLSDAFGALAVASSAGRAPIDATGQGVLDRHMPLGTLLALTSDGEGPQPLLALLEVVALVRSPAPPPIRDPIETEPPARRRPVSPTRAALRASVERYVRGLR